MANFEERIRIYVESGGTGDLDKIRNAFGDLGKVSDKTRAEVEGMLEALGETADVAAKLSAYSALETRLVDTAAKTKSLREEVDRLGEEFLAQENPSSKLVKEYERKTDALAKLEAQQKRYTEDLRRAGNMLRAAGVDTGKLSSEEKRLTDTKASLVQRLREEAVAARQADQAVGGLSGKVKGLIAAAAGYLGLRKLKDTLMEIIGVGDRMERLGDQLESVFGAGNGQATLDRFREIADTVPNSLEDVTQAGIRLRNYGLDPLNGTLEAVLDQTASLGGSMQTLERISLALGQAWGKQKLAGEEIRQLVEAGVPAWEMLARVTGKNVAELQQLSSAGALGRDVISGLIAEMGKANEGAAGRGLNRLSGMWTKLKDVVVDFYDRIASSGPMDFLRQKLEGLLSTMREMAQDGSLQALADRIGAAISGMVTAISSAIGFIARFSREIVGLGVAFATAKIGSMAASAANGLTMLANGARGLLGPVGLVIGGLTTLTLYLRGARDASTQMTPAVTGTANALRELTRSTDENREANIKRAQQMLDSLEIESDILESQAAQAEEAAKRARMLEQELALEGRLAESRRQQTAALEREAQQLRAAADAHALRVKHARDLIDKQRGVAQASREAAAAADEQAGATKEVVEAWKTLGLQGDITGQKVTEAGQKILAAIDALVSNAQTKGEQLGAAITAGIGKASTSAELGELQRRLDTLFEEGRISAEQYARATVDLLSKQQALRVEAEKLAGTYRETGRTAEESLRAQIRQWEVLRGNAVATAEAIRQNLAKAMAEGADDGRIQQLQQQLQQAEARAAALNAQILNANQQLQQTGQQGQQQLQQVSQGFQEVGQAADQAGEQVGRFGRGGAVEELRKAIAAVREEFEALGAEATEFFDKTLLHAARGVNRMGDLFSALNEAATITRQAFVAQQEDAAAQAEQLANLTDESIERMIAAGTTADGLRAKAKRLKDQFTLLGDSDLGRLRSALDSAASKLDAITDKAKQARDQLEDMNRQLQEEALREAGREEELAKLRRDRELARIRELAEASGEINSQTVRENMRLIEERYRRELELIREREREEKRANRDVDRERSSSPGGGSGGRGELTPARREPDRVVRIQIPDVGDVDVVGDDSAAVLERGLQEVARAARAGRRFG